MLWTAASVYVIAAVGFYIAMMRRAPVMEEPAAVGTHPQQSPQVIELFPERSSEQERKAA